MKCSDKFDQALAALREVVLGKKEYNPRDYCQPTDPDDYKQGKTEGYNQAFEDIANLFEGEK